MLISSFGTIYRVTKKQMERICNDIIKNGESAGFVEHYGAKI